MAQDRKKQVSGEIPFHFMQEMGHSPRAMEQFFDLPYQARQVLTDAVCISDEPEERRETALKSLANGGEGYCERFCPLFPLERLYFAVQPFCCIRQYTLS